MDKIGVIGAGAMGSGIAQVAATAGHDVLVFDSNRAALDKSRAGHKKIITRLIEKGKLIDETGKDILSRIHYRETLHDFTHCQLVIEAVIENLEIKKEVFSKLEKIVSKECIIATNTSSLSVASVASACEDSNRVIGIHFFNPAPLMPLVEIIPAVQTVPDTVVAATNLITSWEKTTVQTKDTPGFIVNRVARPFYGEALRIYEEGIADFATIDWAMKEMGGFRMDL